ncbi:hypothetical protein [Imperialibacter sp.]|uniref:hypothetical protein n=1 Tax=Imperialibacter sp. TaxID=2038411 RepID=UPI0032F01C6B
MSRLGNPYSCIAQHRLQVLRNLVYLGWATPPPTLGNTAAALAQPGSRSRPAPPAAIGR